MNLGNLKYFRPFYVYPPIALLMLVYALKEGHFSPLKIVAILLLGLVEWAFLEYFLHRYVLHIDLRWQRLQSLLKSRHPIHHKNTNDLEYMFVPISTGLIISGVSMWLRTLILWSWPGAALVTVGVWTGYLIYEYLHYAAHLKRPKNSLLRYLKLYHLKHHYQDEKRWFGVTNPFTDYLFGTYRPIGRKAEGGGRR